MTTEVLTQSNLETLQEFGTAWNNHDLDGIMSRMTDDCIFYAPAGPDLMGKEHVGQAAVRNAFDTGAFMMKDFVFDDVNYVVHGDEGYMSWTLKGTRPDGVKVVIPGVDLITFRNGKISVKNALVKAKT